MSVHSIRVLGPSTTGRVRKTFPITSAHERIQAALDPETSLQVRHACLLFSQAVGQKVPTAAVFRRALEVYIQHLDASKLSEEVTELKKVCSRRPLQADEVTRMGHALTDHEEQGARLPTTFYELKNRKTHAQALADWEALDARVEALLPKKYQRLQAAQEAAASPDRAPWE